MAAPEIAAIRTPAIAVFDAFGNADSLRELLGRAASCGDLALERAIMLKAGAHNEKADSWLFPRALASCELSGVVPAKWLPSGCAGLYLEGLRFLHVVFFLADGDGWAK